MKYDRLLFESKNSATFELFQPNLVPKALVLPGLTEVKGLEMRLVWQETVLNMRTWSEKSYSHPRLKNLNREEKTKKMQGFFFKLTRATSKPFCNTLCLPLDNDKILHYVTF